MADDFRVVFDEAAMKLLFSSVDGPAGKTLVRAAIIAERRAKILCPVDTGRLRGSITHDIGKSGGMLKARVGTNVTYAGYVEFGTRKMHARPFLRPALDAVRSSL